MSDPTSTRTPSENVDQALARAVLYGSLSAALAPPIELALSPLASEAVYEASTILWGGLQPARDFSPAIDDWRSTHTRLFGHTARGTACPYETEYGQQGLFEQPRELATIAGFYHAFGLEVATIDRERADHVSCELEFMDFLCRKEAYALDSENEEMLAETRKAMKLFLRDHLGRFGVAFARLLSENDPAGFYGSVGELLSELLAHDCRSAGIEPGPQLMQLRPPEDDNVPMACGAESELVQLQVPE